MSVARARRRGRRRHRRARPLPSSPIPVLEPALPGRPRFSPPGATGGLRWRAFAPGTIRRRRWLRRSGRQKTRQAPEEVLPPLTWIGPRRMQVEPISVAIGAGIYRRQDARRLPLLRSPTCSGAEDGPQGRAGLEQAGPVDDEPYAGDEGCHEQGCRCRARRPVSPVPGRITTRPAAAAYAPASRGSAAVHPARPRRRRARRAQ